jgi:hypothetical protein
MVCVPDFKRDVGLWHGILTVKFLIQCQQVANDD